MRDLLKVFAFIVILGWCVAFPVFRIIVIVLSIILVILWIISKLKWH